VDNASQDDSVEQVKQNYPQVRLIENNINKGFAGACNLALRQTTSPYILILNTDIILKPKAVSLLLSFLQQRSDVGLVGGQLFHPNGLKQNSFDNFPTLLTELTNKSLLRLLFPHRYPSKYRVYDEPLEVESVIGACMMVRFQAIQQVGFLDEDYFFFLEETDLCFRLHKAGWKIYHLPAAQIVHFQGQSAQLEGSKARIEYYRSRYLFFKKNYGYFSLTLLVAGVVFRLLGNTLFIILLNLFTLFRLSPYRAKARLYGLLLLWHLCLCPASMRLRSREEKGLWSLFTPPGNTRWFIRTELLPEFTLGTQEGLKKLISGEEGTIIHDRRIRCIIKAELPKQDNTIPIYLKIFKLPRGRDHFKYIFRPSKARKEAKLALKLLDKGIQTIDPLAIGERYRCGILQESYLITKEIRGAFALDKFVLKEAHKLDFRQERAITIALAQLSKELHQLGIYHTDFHAGNLLIQNDPKKKTALLFLMDLHHIKWYKRPLSLKKRINNLVQLNLFFAGRVRSTVRLLFFKEYCRGVKKLETNIAAYARLIEDKTYRASLRLNSRRDKRCLRNNNDFMVYKNGPYKGHISQISQTANLGQDLPLLFEQLENLVPLKEGKKSSLFVKAVPSASGVENIYIKRYCYPGWLGFLRGLGRSSRPLKAWKMAHAVLVRHFNTASPLAVIERRPLGIFREGIFISQEVPGALGIDWFVLKEFSPVNHHLPADKLGKKRAFISCFARLIRRWHYLNLYQRDMKASNILVKYCEQAGSPADRIQDQYKFYFIDLEGVIVVRGLKDKQRIKNLAQLNTSFMRLKFITRTDKLRFLKVYLGHQGRYQRNPLIRKYWYQVAYITSQRLEKASDHYRA
jgi:hypothetical protein